MFIALIRESIFDRKSTCSGVVLDFVCIILALSNSSRQKSLQVSVKNCFSVQGLSYLTELIHEKHNVLKEP